MSIDSMVMASLPPSHSLFSSHPVRFHVALIPLMLFQLPPCPASQPAREPAQPYQHDNVNGMQISSANYRCRPDHAHRPAVDQSRPVVEASGRGRVACLLACLPCVALMLHLVVILQVRSAIELRRWIAVKENIVVVAVESN